MTLALIPCLTLLVCGSCNYSRSRAHVQPPENRTLPAVTFTNVIDQTGIQFRHEKCGVGRRYYVEIIGPGCGLFDYDNDGWLDVYLVQGAPLPGWKGTDVLTNKLYRNQRDGTFEDVTERAGVTGIVKGKKTYSLGCAVADFDNDGNTDLLVTNYGRCILYRNNGNGTFSDVTERAGVTASGFWVSAAFLDYDNDGWLDLFLGNYVTYPLGSDPWCGANKVRSYCTPHVFPTALSRFYRNNGDGTFTDVTERVGMTERGKTLGVVCSDYNADGWVDVYVANDTVRNFLYENKGNGKFVERGTEAGCAFGEQGEAQASMGVDWQDYDGDLRPDIITTNFWLETNELYQNLGNGFFADVTMSSGIGPPSLPLLGWGCSLFDYDNDGWRDLFIHNGHTLDNAEEVGQGETLQPDLLFWNDGRGKLIDVSQRSGAWFSTRHLGRGAAFGDIDNDGDVDILLAQNSEPPALLRNDGGNRNHWVAIKAVGTRSNRSAIGTKIYVTAGGRKQFSEVRSAYSYGSANDLRVHFGLGSATRIDTLEVVWTTGKKEIFKNLPVNRELTVVEGRGVEYRE